MDVILYFINHIKYIKILGINLGGRLMKRYTSVEFNEEVLVKKQSHVVEFFSPTCIHCKKMEKVLDKLSNVYENVNFGAIDISKDMNLAQRYDVKSVPTIIFLKQGEMIQKVIGDTHELVITENIKKMI